jgi:hypothetical protein
MGKLYLPRNGLVFVLFLKIAFNRLTSFQQVIIIS